MQSAAGDSSRRRIESGQVLRHDERNGGKWLRRVAQIDIGLQAESTAPSSGEFANRQFRCEPRATSVPLS